MTEYEIRREDAYQSGGTFTIGDDEVLLDAEMRPPNRVVLAIGSPVDFETRDDETHVCGAATANGECAREVEGVDERCWQHAEGSA